MKKFILGFLADWGLNIVIVFILLALTKVFSPIFLAIVLPAALIYWSVSSAVKSGRVSFLGKSYSIGEKYMFSLDLTIWTSIMLLFPAIAIAHTMNWKNNPIFWALLPLLSILVYCCFLILNPFLKKINEKKRF
jgi:hypothetical protein